MARHLLSAYRLAIIVVALAVALMLLPRGDAHKGGACLIRAGRLESGNDRLARININLLFTLVFGLGAPWPGLVRADAGARSHGADRDGREHPDPRFVIIVSAGIGSIAGAFLPRSSSA